MFLIPKFSEALRIPEASVKRLVHQLRVRYRALLREEVGRTVEKPMRSTTNSVIYPRH